MAANTLTGDLQVQGAIIPRSFVPPAGCITNAAVQAAAGISASKCEQQYSKTVVLADHATAATAVRRQIHTVYGLTGTILSFSVSASVAPTGADTVTVTLKKNGSAILTASIVLDSGNTNFIAEAGTLSSSAVVAGDCLEAEITAVSGTTGKGVAAHLVINEVPSP